MHATCEALDSAIHEVTAARNRVAKIKTPQVRDIATVALLKSIAHTWFQTHRRVVMAKVPNADFQSADQHYTTILNSTAKHAAKQTYLNALRDAKTALVAIRASVLVAPAVTSTGNTDDLAPDFSPLVADLAMREILIRRWQECCKCVNADAHLAAIVMMGGLLEALFVARANKMDDKKELINAPSAPKDKTNGKTLNLQDWMLDSYIRVGCDLGWITASGKDVADKLKEYRNYVHPEKERRHGVVLDLNDSSMFWEVTKALARQLLLSISNHSN